MEILLLSLLDLAAFSLFTAALRLVFLRAAALWNKTQRRNSASSARESDRRNRLGWVSVMAALLGLYLPWVLLGG